MRLINTSTLKLHQFPGDTAEDYAILSHTWGEEECSFQDFSTANVRRRKGFQKIKLCCEQAARDGLKWAWVDTCCIDKTNFNELSEAINSMFKWYKDSKICYAYLADVVKLAELASSRWFTRGWTLQELIAPAHVRFYSSNWSSLGSKSDLGDIIQRITGIDTYVLSTGHFRHVSVAKRMSWAAKRKTTVIEDLSYSLMGIFEINMPLIYGEGEKAFRRLQYEILRISDDQSLFAWGAPERFCKMHDFSAARSLQMHGLLADAPADFATNHEILKASSQKYHPPPVIYGNGLRIEYPVCTTRGTYEFIVMACTTRGETRAYIGIPITTWGDSFYARCGPLVLISPDSWGAAHDKVLTVKAPPPKPISFPATFQIVRVPNNTRPRNRDQFKLDEVYCLPRIKYSSSEHSIALSPQHRGQQAALFFESRSVRDLKRELTPSVIPHLDAFAVVLGYSDSPWAIFVPILTDVSNTGSNHLPATPKGYMKKQQVKDTLLRNTFPPGKRRFDQLLSIWTEPRPFGQPVLQNLAVSVDLDVQPINLIEEGVFVSIDIYEVAIDPKTSRPQLPNPKLTEQRRKNYKPDWMTADKLEWFLN